MSVAMSYELMITLNEPWIVIKQHQHELRCLVHQDHYVQRLICEFSVKNQPLSASVSALERKQAHFVKRMASFISAYVRVKDTLDLEADLARVIQTQLRSANNSANTRL